MELFTIFFAVIGLVVQYWLIRFAVSHGTADALRRDRMLQAGAVPRRSMLAKATGRA
jgi:hypothetical protein